MGILYFKSKGEKISDDKLQKLIEVNMGRLYKFAYVYVKNEGDAKDIVQETVYKAFANIRKLNDTEMFNSWITRILINTAMDYLKKRNKFSYGSESELENYPVKDEIHVDLYDAVDNLQGLDKTVIILKYFEDYKIKDIATILEISESKVKNHLHSGLNKLRLELEEI
ncbi:MAG: sigma-70 family RNA polymerase sigma factor [Clostridium sp.]|uniref:sigma-70 family RNA polymerase sigma factor n=1 Tax=Clostridium sp. TaxID=1506 RepID=UPI003023EBD3